MLESPADEVPEPQQAEQAEMQVRTSDITE